MKTLIFSFFSIALATTAFGSVSREHCRSLGDRVACFIEVENEGESHFYTSSEDYASLLLDGQVANLNIELTELSLTDYANLYLTKQPPRFVYEPSLISAYDFSDNACSTHLLNGWWLEWGKCGAGTLGGAITGGLGGFAIAGPIGAGLGTIGGGLTGAAASCGSTFSVRYRDSMVEISSNC